MDVHLHLALLLIHVVTLFCAVNGGNMTEEYLGDNQAVTPRPATMQNIRTPQCENCADKTTKKPRIHGSIEPHTYHTTPSPYPPPSPTEYVLVGVHGPCLRIKAIFIVRLNTTNITNVIIPSPPDTEAYGECYDSHKYLSLSFPGGNLHLVFMKNETEDYSFLNFITVHVEIEEEMYMDELVYLEAMVTPLGSSFTSEEVELRLATDVTVVLKDVKVQAFKVDMDDLTEGDENTHIVYDRENKLLSDTTRHWSVTRLVPSIYTVVFLVALPLNIMAIVMFLVKMKVRKPAVVYMLNLATADVLLIGVLPFYIIYRFTGSTWVFGEGMCRFVMAAFYCNMYCSSLLMTSISVDRFLAFVYPMWSLPWRTVKRAWLVCGVIWLISWSATVPVLLIEQTSTFDAKVTICHDYQHFFIYLFFLVIYFPSSFSLFIFFPLLITSFCYIGIIRSLSKSNFNGTHKRTRAISLSMVVLCVFVLCFVPANVIYLVHLLNLDTYLDHSLYIAYIVSSCISSINCCLDPLIYYFASSECQKYVCSLLGWKKDHRPVEQELIRVHEEQQAERNN